MSDLPMSFFLIASQDMNNDEMETNSAAKGSMTMSEHLQNALLGLLFVERRWLLRTLMTGRIPGQGCRAGLPVSWLLLLIKRVSLGSLHSGRGRLLQFFYIRSKGCTF
jgi:hypothetical protein